MTMMKPPTKRNQPLIFFYRYGAFTAPFFIYITQLLK